MGGNKKLFKKILLSFYSDNEDMVDQIKDALAKDDIELVHRLAHTLKGVSGNVTAKNAFTHAESLESAVKKKDEKE